MILRPRPDGGAERERGSAVVEFLTLGVLLLVPVVYLVLTLGRIQAAAFAADGSAREAARAFVVAPDEPTGRARAAAAVQLGVLDQGFGADVGSLRLSCTRTPCLTPQAQVAAEVSVHVLLPWVPGPVDRVVPVHVTVRARQVAVVDAYRVQRGG